MAREGIGAGGGGMCWRDRERPWLCRCLGRMRWVVAWGGAHPVTARVVVSVTLLLAVPAWWHHPAVAVLTRYVYVCFGPGTLHSTGPPLAIRYHALLSHPSFVWTLCCHSRRCRNRVYVSYWYYKRPDIPSGVRRRPSGRDKTGGELFFSTHLDENKVQTLMGHCKVYDRPVWLDRGSKTAPMHTYYCSKVYDLQGQYVGGFCVGVVGGGGCSPLSHGCAPCPLFFYYLLGLDSTTGECHWCCPWGGSRVAIVVPWSERQ